MQNRMVVVILISVLILMVLPAGSEAMPEIDLDQFIGFTTPETIIDPETGQILIREGTVITKEMIQRLIDMDYINKFRSYIVPVAGVSLNKGNLEILVENTDLLYANITPADATFKIVKWTSSAPGIVQVSERQDSTNLSNISAIVKGVSPGTATITVTTLDGNKKASCQVRVLSPVTSITMHPTEATLLPQENLKIQAAVVPAEHTKPGITWESTNAAAATVDQSGFVTARSEGETRIIARSVQDNTITSFCAVTVAAPADLDPAPADNEENGLQDEAELNDEDEDDSELDYLLIALIGIIALVIILIVVLLVFKR